jgi:integrase
MQKLTEAAVAGMAIDGRDRIVFDAGTAGFGVRITPKGTKIFIVQARVGGQPRPRVPIGRWPDMTVAKARTLARDALADLRAGRDPRAEREARARAIEAGQLTVAQFAELWLTEHVEKKLKRRTAADYRILVERKINPAIGHLVLGKVAKPNIIELHESMAATPRRANYVVRTIGAMMTYAEEKGLRPQNSNPCRRIKMYRERTRERFMTEAELSRAAEAITACEQEGTIGPHAAAALRLALLTGARSGELTAIRWAHVDWGRRQVRLPDDGDEPGRKTGARTIYLSEAAIEVLRTVPRIGPYVIAGAKQGEPYKNLSRAWIIVRAKAGLHDVRLHDVRHSYASVAAAKGHSLPMIGKLLGHRVPATTARYALGPRCGRRRERRTREGHGRRDRERHPSGRDCREVEAPPERAHRRCSLLTSTAAMPWISPSSPGWSP